MSVAVQLCKVPGVLADKKSKDAQIRDAKNMAEIILQPTTTAHWHSLVSEAESAVNCALGEDLESYLVFLLMRFTNQPHMAERIMSVDYLSTEGPGKRTRQEQLRDVGDHCLLFSGLFPRHAERRSVKVSYFVELGRSAYYQLANAANVSNKEVYTSLSENFVLMMDILQTMRSLRSEKPGMTLLHAYELWNDTGSRHAFNLITDITKSHPIRTDVIDLESTSRDAFH